MHRIMTDDSGLRRIFILFVFLLLSGVTGGSIYFMRHSGGYSGLTEYLTSFFQNTASGIDKYAVFKNTLRSNLILLGIIFISGFFRPGFLIAGACALRKGFIVGFTIASFIRCFGLRGMLVSFAYLPGFLLIFPAFLVFCSVSSRFSLQKDRFRKKIIFSYIFFSIFMVTIFCAASFLEGYLTTTFMARFASCL